METVLPSILFVDDEQRIVSQLRQIFRGRYQVHTATSGAEALQILQSVQVDLIVSDQRMPGMLGIELLAEVRKHWPNTMRMLLTGYSDLAAIVGSVNEGEVFRFINKPWDHEEIQETVADAIAAGQAARTSATASLVTEAALDEMSTHTSKPYVLMIDDCRDDANAMAQVLAADQSCLIASSVDEALMLMADYEVGVIITEARVGKADMGSFLHLLKREHPMVTTVMLTRSDDADLVIRLINKAQVFRFATKPLRKSSFQLAVAAAMREHGRFRLNPALVHRHRVASDAQAHGDASLVSSMSQALSRLKTRFSLFRKRSV